MEVETVIIKYLNDKKRQEKSYESKLKLYEESYKSKMKQYEQSYESKLKQFEDIRNKERRENGTNKPEKSQKRRTHGWIDEESETTCRLDENRGWF